MTNLQLIQPPDPRALREHGDSFDPRSRPLHRLYRGLRRELLAAAPSGDADAVVEHVLDAAMTVAFEESSPVLGGRVYRRVGDAYELYACRGEAGVAPLGYRVPLDYPVIADVRRQGWALVSEEDPRFDPAIEAPFAASVFAAIVLGDDAQYLLSLTLGGLVPEGEIAYAMAALASLGDDALSDEAHSRGRLARSVDEAHRIQTSLLRSTAPAVDGYDIGFRLRPAEAVGGDVFDFYASQPDVLGVCVGDACGHGLPAALQARDLIVGLRMGVEQNLKLVSTMEKLARVMAETGPLGRFISMVYAEIDVDGTLIYVNAGHVPALILRRDGRVVELESTGPVLGVPAAVGPYRRATDRLRPGDMLVLYTDGITEATDGRAELGVQGLARWLTRHRGCGTQTLVDRVFEELDRFTGGGEGETQADDQTLVIVSRDAIGSGTGAPAGVVPHLVHPPRSA